MSTPPSSSVRDLSAGDLVPGCRLVELPRINDQRGNLTAIEGGSDVPFDLRRVYYLYDVPGGEARAGHAHFELQQLIIAASGSFDVLLDDGRDRVVVPLNRAYQGLLVSRTVWREIYNFSSGAVCLVLASEHYDEADYIRDYEAFLREVGVPADQPRPAVRRIGDDQYTHA